MAEKFLTLKEIEDIFLEMTRLILGIPNDNATVRLDYGGGSPTGSSPAHNPKKSTCYLSVSLADDGYCKQKHIHYEAQEDSDKLMQVMEFTEQYAVTFSYYGADSFDKARKIVAGLHGEENKAFLHSYDIHLLNCGNIVPARELIDTSWVSRSDFTAVFTTAARFEKPDAVNGVTEVAINLNP